MSAHGAGLAAPLVAGRTYLRGVHLLLGGVLALPYIGLGWLFASAFGATRGDVTGLVVLAVLAVAVAVAIAFIPAVRLLEVVAARSLLGVALPDPDPEQSRTFASRWRSAAWYLGNLVGGSVFVVAVLAVLPAVAVLLATPFTGAPIQLTPTRSLDLDPGWQSAATVPVALALAVAFVYLTAGAGVLLARAAPAALGPTAGEQLVDARRRVRELGERNRLARELHDSVGHALSATALQAAAAARVLDTDPEFARRALAAIERAGRAAVDDLDHVLGVLRAGTADDRPDDDRTSPDLAGLDALLDGVRAAGVAVDATVVGPSDDLAAVVSRTAYRVVQEALTNAMRHGDGTGTVRLTVVDEVEVEVTNPRGRAAPARPDGGRGLRGLAERVEVLGGRVVAGPDESGTVWRVRATMPRHPGRPS